MSAPTESAAHDWSSATFADIADISQAHWHYYGTAQDSQTALVISFPGHRVSCQLDRQLKAAINSHAALVVALEYIDRDLTTLLCERSLTTLAFLEVRKNRDSARAGLKLAQGGDK